MSDFKKLKAPEESTRGWYITTDYKDDEDVAWLTTTGIISNDTDYMSILFHASELEAHDAAIEYYAGYLQAYPYVNEMNALLKDDDSVESKVMEFV